MTDQEMRAIRDRAKTLGGAYEIHATRPEGDSALGVLWEVYRADGGGYVAGFDTYEEAEAFTTAPADRIALLAELDRREAA